MGAAMERFAAGRPADALVTLGDNDYTESPAAFRSELAGLASAGRAADGLARRRDTRQPRHPASTGGRYEFDAPRDAGPLLPAPRRRRRALPPRLEPASTSAQMAWLDAALRFARTRPGRSSPSTIRPTAAASTAATAACRRRLGAALRARTASTSSSPRHDHNYQRFAGSAASLTSSTAAAAPRLYCARAVPEPVPATQGGGAEMHGWLYLRATADSLRVRAIGPRGPQSRRPPVHIYP